MGVNMHLNQIPVNTPTDNHTHTLTHACTTTHFFLTLIQAWMDVESTPFQLRKIHTPSQKSLHSPVDFEIIEQRDYRNCITQNRWDCQVECGIMSALHIAVQRVTVLLPADSWLLDYLCVTWGTDTHMVKIHTRTYTDPLRWANTLIKAC